MFFNRETTQTRLIGGKELRCELQESAAGMRVLLSAPDAPGLPTTGLATTTTGLPTTALQPTALPVAALPAAAAPPPNDKPDPYLLALVDGATAWAKGLDVATPAQQRTNADVRLIGPYVIISATTGLDHFRSHLQFLPAELEYPFTAEARRKFDEKKLADRQQEEDRRAKEQQSAAKQQPAAAVAGAR